MMLENALYTTTMQIQMQFDVMVLQSYLIYLLYQVMVLKRLQHVQLFVLVQYRLYDFDVILPLIHVLYSIKI